MRRALVITVSDRGAAGLQEDASGPAAVEVLKANGFRVTGPLLVPDEQDQIVAALRAGIDDGVDLLVTTGGTGLAERDVTPEATAQVITRLVPGVAELMRAEGSKNTPLAALSRGLCGTAGSSLVLNLPGSPKGVIESLAAVRDVLPHALDVLRGSVSH